MSHKEIEQLELLVKAVNDLGEKSIVDWVSLCLAITSVVIAIMAVWFTKNQRDISRRAERQSVYLDVLNILFFLKSYDGSISDESEKNFKKLQKTRAIVHAVFDKEAYDFINELLDKMYNIPARKSAFEEGVSEESAKIYEQLGIDPNIHDALAIEYTQYREYFRKGSFTDFERIFKINNVR